MAYRSQPGLGAFIRPEYSVLGACDGASSTGPTGNPKATWMWMKGPGGVTGCYAPNDPKILQDAAPQMQIWTSAPELPNTPKPAASSASGGSASSLVDTAMAWVKANPWVAAGIAAAGVFFVVKK